MFGLDFLLDLFGNGVFDGWESGVDADDLFVMEG